MLEDKKGVTGQENSQDEQDPNAEGTETAEESTEDADSASDTSDDTSSEQSSDDKTNKKLFFMDPKNLPAELKPHFEKMQASFTRKMQLVSGVAKKAQAFDDIVRDPEVRAVLDKKYGNTNGKAKDDDDDEGDSVEARIEEKVEERVGPIERERAHEKLKSEFQEFSTKYPFYKNYEMPLKEILSSNPNLTFREGLASVVLDDLLELVGTDLKSVIEQKKRGNLTRPNKGTSVNKGSSTKAAQTIKEAFEMAKASQGVK
jgi:hypothetical protein